MVDTPNSNGNTGNIRVRKIRAGNISTREMQVERLTVNTGETRSAESDMMEELKVSITDQTDTLEKLLKSIDKSIGSNAGTKPTGSDSAIKKMDDDLTLQIKQLRAAIVAQTTQQSTGGGGDEGGGGGAAGTVGDAVAAARMITTARKEIDDYFGKEGTKWKKLNTYVDSTTNQFVKLAMSGAIDTIEGNLLDLATVIQRTSSNLVDLSNITEGVTKRFTSAIDSSTSGIVNMTSSFFDFFPTISRGGDNFEDTMELIRNSVGQNLIGPMGTMGEDFNEVSRNIRDFRLNMRDQDVIAFDRMGFKESNESMVMLFDLERRRSISAEIADTQTASNMQSNLGFLQMIAHNTGQSVVELLKANRSSDLKIANIGAAGVLSESDVTAFTNAARLVGSQPGMESITDMIIQLAMTGASPELMMAENPELRDALVASGNPEFLGQLLATIRSSSGQSDTDAGNSLMGFLGDTEANQLGIAGSNIMKGVGADIFGAFSMARTEGYDVDAGDEAASMLTTVTDFLSNTLGSNGALVAAIIGNVGALWANTGALLGRGGLLGLIGGGFGKIGGLFGKMSRSIRGLALGAAMLTTPGIGMGATGAIGGAVGAGRGLVAGAAGVGRGALAGARGMGGAALGLGRVGLGAGLRAIPGIGAVAGLGYGAYKALKGDWTGAALSAGAGLAGLVPGVGTAASVGLSATLAAHEMGAFGGESSPAQPATVAPQSMAAATTATINQGMRNDTQRLLLENNRLISRMIDLLVDGNDLSDDIRQNTAKAMVSPDPSLWARLTGTADEISPHSGG